MLIDNYKLSKELEHVLASYLFESKSQMQRLLNYLVNHSTSTSESVFDQRVIAQKCLGRSACFDPAENPVVRIEMGRLRKLLKQFYKEDPQRPYKIDIPLGQYRPVITVEAAADKSKYLPELTPSPASPERLSVLLQFTTEGVDSSALYLLRHQVRIGITIALGKQKSVRLLVAVPDERGSVADSIDCVMHVSISSKGKTFLLVSAVTAVESEKVLFSNESSLDFDCESSQIDELLNQLVSELFDHEIGVLWEHWIETRSNYQSIGASRVEALVQYQNYLRDESEKNISLAFHSIKMAQEHYPGNKLLNCALADLYYRMIIHGFELVNEPIEMGLIHIRKSLRFSPASEKLHVLHAFLTVFQGKYSFAITSQLVPEHVLGGNFSIAFQYQILKCLVMEWSDGFHELESLCRRFSRYPKLFSVAAYLNSILNDEKVMANQWRKTVKEQGVDKSAQQFVRYMKLPKAWAKSTGREELFDVVRRDLGVKYA